LICVSSAICERLLLTYVVSIDGIDRLISEHEYLGIILPCEEEAAFCTPRTTTPTPAFIRAPRIDLQAVDVAIAESANVHAVGDLHDSGTAEGLKDPDHGFVIDAIGTNTNPQLSDEGIEYYRYLS
jgi:hypothetical protein